MAARQGPKRQLQDGERHTIVGGMMKYVPLILICATATLSGCGLVAKLQKPPAAEPVQIVAPVEDTVVLPAPVQGSTAAAMDATSAADKKAALAAPAAGGERSLGKTSVALGSPVEQGFWVKSDRIAAAGKGRVVIASGKSVAVDLMPGTGGALLSLAAYRALGLSLTDLPEVEIFAN